MNEKKEILEKVRHFLYWKMSNEFAREETDPFTYWICYDNDNEISVRLYSAGENDTNSVKLFALPKDVFNYEEFVNSSWLSFYEFENIFMNS